MKEIMIKPIAVVTATPMDPPASKTSPLTDVYTDVLVRSSASVINNTPKIASTVLFFI